MTCQVVYGSNDLDALQAQLGETKTGHQSRGPRGHAASHGAGAHPVTEVGHLMYAIEKVQSYAAEKPAAVFVKNAEAVPFLVRAGARRDKFLRLFNRIVLMAPGQPH